MVVDLFLPKVVWQPLADYEVEQEQERQRGWSLLARLK